MLYLLFHVKEESYAVDVREVVEVVPRVKLRSIPKAPEYVAGLLNYRGDSVPVLDLCMLLHDTKCAPVFGSRIVLVQYLTAGSGKRVLGLLAEQVTDTMQCKAEEFRPSTLLHASAPYLREVITYRDHLVQRVEVDALLPTEVQALLF
ncbi:MAG: chemotaxis protein CheW [Gammaproteobacteria bacterium]|nr:chemotaxis protein CheW [Gammaproteobacteria bacterium]